MGLGLLFLLVLVVGSPIWVPIVVPLVQAFALRCATVTPLEGDEADKLFEQATLFVRDPSGNALEFKSFRDPSKLFAVE